MLESLATVRPLIGLPPHILQQKGEKLNRVPPAASAVASDGRFLRRALIVAAVVVALLLLWRLREVVLLLFAATVASLVLTSLAEPIQRVTRLGAGVALALAGLLLAALLGLIFAFMGWRIQAQLAEAADLLPQAVTVGRRWLSSSPLGTQIDRQVAGLHIGVVAPALLQAPSYALSALRASGDGLLVLAGGVYLAAQPQLYLRGALRLLPPTLRGRLVSPLDEIGAMLRKWLLAELIAMATVGLAVGVGTWLIGVPAPGALGLFAGLAEFVPIVGPVVSAVPALLLALLHGLDKTGWTLLLFVAIQQVEGNLLLPFLQRRIVLLPPVLTLFALVSFGVVFGLLGVFLATPLTIVAVVLVRRLYLDPSPERPAGGEPPFEQERPDACSDL